MFRVALYRQSVNSPIAAIWPSSHLAALPRSSNYLDDATQVILELADVEGLAEASAIWGRRHSGRDGCYRLDLYELPRVAGHWARDNAAWFDRLTADFPHDRMAPAVTGGRAFPFLCETGRIAKEPLPASVQREHLAYVTGRARNLLLGGWLERKASFGEGAALPDVCGIFVYQAENFSDADRLGWQDPTAHAGYWTPLPFEPAEMTR